MTEVISLEEYHALYGKKKVRVKGQKKIKGVSTDKAFMFANAWRDFAPKDAPRLIPEYRFCPDRNFSADWRMGRGYKILIEVEGATRRANGGRHNTNEDRNKYNLAAALGWRVFRFSTEVLEQDPAGCVELVLKGLRLKKAA